MSADKIEYAPLLAPGDHSMTLEQLEQACVCAFPHSTKRKVLLDRLVRSITRIQKILPSCTLWIDGSFLTQKPDPSDLDCAVIFPGEHVDELPHPSGMELASLIHSMVHEKQLDAYTFFEYPEGHQKHDHWRNQRDYWHSEWSRSRAGVPKGLAVIRIECAK